MNEETNKLFRHEKLVHLGLSLKYIVSAMADSYNPKHLFLLAKLDIKDIFWRIVVSNDYPWSFCNVLPSIQPVSFIDNIYIVVPNNLQMGWCENLPFSILA